MSVGHHVCFQTLRIGFRLRLPFKADIRDASWRCLNPPRCRGRKLPCSCGSCYYSADRALWIFPLLEIAGMMRDVLLWRSMSTPWTYDTAYINVRSSQDLVCATKIKEAILCSRLYCICIMCSFLWNLRSEVPLWGLLSIYYRPESMFDSLITHMRKT